jgi:hypothetical protein
LGEKVRKQEMVEAEKNQPTPVEEPVQELPPPRPPTPAPCLSLKGCPDFQNHVDTSNKMLGRVCNVIRIPCNQLPGPDKECPLERKERLKNTAPAGFIRAGELVEEIAGAKVIKPAQLKIMAIPVNDEQAGQWLTAIIRGNFTKLEQEEWEEIRTLVRNEGQYDESDLGVFRQIKQWTAERIGGA